jgi:para-nitrobenzyl esterase
MIRDGRKRPVMFYSHGGGYAVGSGGGEDFQENQYHDGNALARNYDVVVVTHNHRLGLLGYLYLGEILGEEYAASGCAGMLDIVAALEWVRDNIEEFGGDPNCVMIFGESGGGAKTTVLTALPSAQGLFHRASVESGSMLDASPRDRATDLARKVLAQLGLKESEAKQLLTIPAERLLEAQDAVAPFAVELSKSRPTLNRALGFAPLVDGHFLPANPYDPRAPLISANIPMIVGTNKDETILFYQHEAAIFRMDDADLRKRVSDMFGDDAGKILNVYRKSRPEASPTDLFIAITSAQMMWANAIKMAERKAELNAAPVYMYQCTYESNLLVSQDPPYRYKTMHSVEIPLKFDHPESPILLGSNPDRFQAARNMSHAWASFARNGTPSFDGSLNWPAYTLDKRETMLLTAECHVVSDPNREERLLWQQLS